MRLGWKKNRAGIKFMAAPQTGGMCRINTMIPLYCSCRYQAVQLSASTLSLGVLCDHILLDSKYLRQRVVAWAPMPVRLLMST